MYKNFLHLIGVELWKDWEKDFTEDPKKYDKNTKEFQLLEEENFKKVLKDTVLKATTCNWLTTDVPKHTELFLDRLFPKTKAKPGVNPHGDQLQQPV